ncbi:YmfQ family protein, partial [Brevibacillus laterosporus]
MDRDRKRSMIDSLPPYYIESTVVGNLLEQEAAELDRFSHAVDDATDQLVINTATWGLDRWEAIFDLPNKKYADLTWDIVTVNGPVFNALDQYTWDGLSEAS